MLRLHPKGPDLWDSVLPDDMRKLPEELERVDMLLHDERLMEPFLRRFNETLGRPGVPIATYLRLMYLKLRYKLSYETLAEEVSDSIRWRRFCGFGYTDRVPDASTLARLTQKYGDETLAELHRMIVGSLADNKLIRARKLPLEADPDTESRLAVLRLLSAGLNRLSRGASWIWTKFARPKLPR